MKCCLVKLLISRSPYSLRNSRRNDSALFLDQNCNPIIFIFQVGAVPLILYFRFNSVEIPTLAYYLYKVINDENVIDGFSDYILDSLNKYPFTSIKESFKNMKSNEFVFSIMDEIFVSTNYNEGLSGAYAVARKMASFDNSICIISTHFSKLSKYCGDEENFYKNYHFSIDYDKDNKIIKTYKLHEGTSKQHIALEMLEEKGFDNDLINDAKKMYNELKLEINYYKPKPP